MQLQHELLQLLQLQLQHVQHLQHQLQLTSGNPGT